MSDSYLKYWVNKDVENADLGGFHEFSIRCYFDNDSDELINHHGKNGLVDLDVYRQLLKSIKKMGYNAIDIHDQLGRAEFYLWDSYKKFWDFHGDIDHITQIIDMAHEEGLLVQIPMFLAWGFNHIDDSFDCWVEHGNEWKNIWAQYMESALGKADIFILRPRSPIYDHPYECKCENCRKIGVGQIMTEVFAAIEDIIMEYRPDAKLICDLYYEGFGLWASGELRVSKNWMLMVCDNGYGKLPDYKEMGQDNYNWGIYLHAGFWLNHTIQDPHLESLYHSVKLAREKNLDSYILVNGQSFKDFVLNLEAVSSLLQYDFCTDLSSYTIWKERFLTDWISRIFTISSTSLIRKIVHFIDRLSEFHLAIAVRKAYLDKKEDLDRGFTATMIHIIYHLIDEVNRKANSEKVGENFVPASEYRSDGYLYRQMETCLIHSRSLKKLAEEIETELREPNKVLWNDKFGFSQKLFTAQYEFAIVMLRALNGEEDINVVKKSLQHFYEMAENGTGLEGFEDWYKPSFSRMHHPIPDLDIFEF
ncbi:MAG: glycosyl hydrolase 115 family protein [Lachnospiraceae bacterium]